MRLFYKLGKASGKADLSIQEFKPCFNIFLTISFFLC
jgi:hypothetical protein